MQSSLVENTEKGLYCPAGDFYVDPWSPVERAVVTHAHADHARAGSSYYLTAAPGVSVLRLRIGEDAVIQSVPYGEQITIGDLRLSFHPAGHILGSSQVRLEKDGEVLVFSGDYKTEPDATATPFEPVRCHTFITESTFALPIYRWRAHKFVFDEINSWWSANSVRGKTSIIYAYALGKSQRILSGLDPSVGPIALHGAITRFLPAYAAAGIALPTVVPALLENLAQYKGRGLVIAPPSAAGSSWLRKFAPYSEGYASGWMQIRGVRRRRSIDRGFVLSDHADWEGLLAAIGATGAQNVGVTHGYTDTLARYLSEHGLNSWVVPTRFAGDEEAGGVDDIPAEDLTSVDGNDTT